jgi:hypothetical protein
LFLVFFVPFFVGHTVSHPRKSAVRLRVYSCPCVVFFAFFAIFCGYS